jgi:hypothetical protein
MRVNRRDGQCRHCSGQLVIIEADDATMTVECQDCNETYFVEPDAFGDGGLTYWADFMARRQDEVEL